MISKKGVSPVIATVLLILLSVVLVVTLFSWGKDIASRLEPSVNCEGVKFNAEIYKTENYFLEIVNTGTLQLEGFEIKSIDSSEITIKENSDVKINPGSTEKIILSDFSVEDENKNFLITPKIKFLTPDGEIISLCPTQYSLEISFSV